MEKEGLIIFTSPHLLLSQLTKDTVLAQLLAEHQHTVGEETLGLRVCIALGLSRQLRDSLDGRHLGPRCRIRLQVLFRFCLQLLHQLYRHVCFLLLSRSQLEIQKFNIPPQVTLIKRPPL